MNKAPKKGSNTVRSKSVRPPTIAAADQKLTLGERINIAREEHFWSQTQLAKEVGVSRGAVGQWELGISAPSLATLRRIAERLDVNFDWLESGRGKKDALGAFERDLRSDSPKLVINVQFTLKTSRKLTFGEYSAKLREFKAVLRTYGDVTGFIKIGKTKSPL